MKAPVAPRPTAAGTAVIGRLPRHVVVDCPEPTALANSISC